MGIKCRICLVYGVFSKYISINIGIRQNIIIWGKNPKNINTNQEIIENNEQGVVLNIYLYAYS